MVSGGARAVARCDALGVAPYSDMAHGLYRGYLTKAYAAAQEALAGWMAQAGMAVRRDAAANLIGRYEGTLPGAPTTALCTPLCQCPVDSSPSATTSFAFRCVFLAGSPLSGACLC